jgi:hypothetical protein
MKNPSGNKLEKLVFGMFDQMVEGADKYVTKQGSTWLIFTESKKWVIEFTRDKTLWFNFNIFQGELELIGKDCTEEKDLIKNWFESRFLNKPKVNEAHHVDVMKFFDKKMENTIQNGVKYTYHFQTEIPNQVEDTIQNGVKETQSRAYRYKREVEDTIQNGVKDTQTRMWPPVGAVEDTIQNGVKDTQYDERSYLKWVEDTIQNGVKEAKEDRLFRTIHVMNAIVNGVKHVEDGDWLDQDERIDDIIENGVKETKESMLESLEQIDHQVTNSEITENINDAIENGVKELKVWKSNRCEEHGYFEFVDGIPTYKPMTQVKDVLENGVKKLKELPDKSGEFRGYGDWYRTQGNMTKPHTEYVKEVIEDSYNHRGRIEGVIRNTNKYGI